MKKTCRFFVKKERSQESENKKILAELMKRIPEQENVKMELALDNRSVYGRNDDGTKGN